MYLFRQAMQNESLNTVLTIFAGLFGLAFGSFLNVCIARLPLHESIVRPRSRCPQCRAQLRDRDNLPVMSWLLLRGRCRSCGKRIVVRYPVVELASTAIFAGFVAYGGLTAATVGGIVFCWMLLGLAVMDGETMVLPDAFTLPGIALGVVFAAIAGGWRGGLRSVLAAVGAAAVLLGIRAIYWALRRREGLGLGDAKLMAMIAAWLGAELGLLALFMGVVSAAMYALGWLAVARPKGAGQLKLPLGVFLCAGAAYAYFFGSETVAWYLGLFHLG